MRPRGRGTPLNPRVERDPLYGDSPHNSGCFKSPSFVTFRLSRPPVSPLRYRPEEVSLPMAPKTNAERQAEFKARQREVKEQESEIREQAIRDHYGYTKSETRTERERSDAAARMLGRPSGPQSREAYIHKARLGAREVSRQMLEFPDRDSVSEAGREERAAKYAAWRFDEHRAGNVSSL